MTVTESDRNETGSDGGDTKVGALCVEPPGRSKGARGALTLVGSKVVSPVLDDPMMVAMAGTELAAVRFLVAIVGERKYGGPGFANLLMRADVRAYAAAIVEPVLGKEVFDATVAALEKKTMAAPELAFPTAVSQLAVVHHVCAGTKGDPVPGAFCDDIWEGLGASYQTPYLAVAGGVMKSLPRGVVGTRAVVPESVYRAFLQCEVVVESDDVHVSVSMAADGSHSVVRKYDSASAVSVLNLPEGRYNLPGGFGLVVSRELMVYYLQRILVLPTLAQTEGYCYLNVLPPDERYMAARVLGKRPTIAKLIRTFPSCTTWCDQVAIVQCTQGDNADVVGGKHLYHVSVPGRLPGSLPGNGYIGGESSLNDLKASIFPLIDEVFGSSPPAAPPPPVANPSSSSASSTPFRFPIRQERQAPPPGPSFPSFSQSDYAASGDQYSGGAVARYAPYSVESTWQAVDEPDVKDWVERMSSGAPLGRDSIVALLRTGNRSLPEVPGRSGRTLVIPQSGTAAVAEGLSWQVAKCPLPGWNAECAKVKTGKDYCLIPPIPGGMCRYELSVSGNFVINRRYTVPGHRTTLWTSGPVLASAGSGHGYIWRFFSDTGSAVAGPKAMELQLEFAAPVVRAWTTTFTAEIILVPRMSSRSGDGRFFRYLITKRLPSGNTRLVIHLPGSGESQPVVIRVQSVHIMGVLVHEVRFSPVGATISFITDSLNASFSVGLESLKGSSEVTFEVLVPAAALPAERPFSPGMERLRIGDATMSSGGSSSSSHVRRPSVSSWN